MCPIPSCVCRIYKIYYIAIILSKSNTKNIRFWDDFPDSQKEIIHSLQSLWVLYIENLQNSYWSYWASPKRATENYAREVSNLTDSTIVATRLANNNIFASMEAVKILVQHERDNAKEFSQLNANVAKTFENVARDNLRDFSTREEIQTHSGRQ